MIVVISTAIIRHRRQSGYPEAGAGRSLLLLRGAGWRSPLKWASEAWVVNERRIGPLVFCNSNQSETPVNVAFEKPVDEILSENLVKAMRTETRVERRMQSEPSYCPLFRDPEMRRPMTM